MADGPPSDWPFGRGQYIPSDEPTGWADEPPSDSDGQTIQELLVTAEIALRNYLVVKSQAAQGGCCADPVWRGRLCEYHQGYADGIDLALDHSALIDEFLGPDVEPLPHA